jgi:uncharacterized protein YukE
MDTTKKIIAFQKRQRKKLLKRLKVSEPIEQAKKLLKESVERAIEQQEVVKKKVGEKQQENINRFKELRSAFPELTDAQFNTYAREQLGLDIPKSAIAELPEKERVKALKEKISKQPKSNQILVDIDVEKRRKEDIAKQSKQLQEMDVIKKGQLDILKAEIDDIIKKRDDILKQTKTSLDELKRKFEGKGNQGRMSDDKKIFRQYQKFEEELIDLQKKLPFTPKKVKITKKSKLEAEPAVEPAPAPAPAVEPAAAAIENMPEAAMDVKAYSNEVEGLRVDVAKQLANLKNAKDENEKNQYLGMINTLSGEIDRLGEGELSKVIDLEATAANKDWDKANKAAPAVEDDLFGKGLRKITKNNIGLYHIHHKNIKDMGKDYVLTKRGMAHAGALAGILRPKEFEKMLTFSLINHIKKNKKS